MKTIALFLIATVHHSVASGTDPVWRIRKEGEYEQIVLHEVKVGILKTEFVDSKTKAQSIEILKTQIKDVLGLVPAPFRDRVKSTKIWVDSGLAAAYSDDSLAMYMGTDNRLECEKLWKGNIIVSATKILSPGLARAEVNRRTHRYWLLHECVHMIHDQVLGFGNAKIIAAFQVAVERKLYEEVWTIYADENSQYFGRVKEKPNTRKNEKEYFAELSVAYLAINNAYPYDREDLKKHDPIAFGIMKEVWGDKK